MKVTDQIQMFLPLTESLETEKNMVADQNITPQSPFPLVFRKITALMRNLEDKMPRAKFLQVEMVGGSHPLLPKLEYV